MRSLGEEREREYENQEIRLYTYYDNDESWVYANSIVQILCYNVIRTVRFARVISIYE